MELEGVYVSSIPPGKSLLKVKNMEILLDSRLPKKKP
jgi:hypothetical protein